MGSWTITEPRAVSLDGEPVRQFDVRLNAGRLSVMGTDGPPRVEITKVSEAAIKVDLADGALSVTHDDVGRWTGWLEPLWWWLHGRQRFACDVSIALPYSTPGVLWVGSGSVVASGLYADLDVACVSGRITLLGVDGTLRAKVTSGPIEALGCAGAIELETVSGEITVADAAAARLRAKTVSGALTADLDNPPDGCDIRLETISGEITIRVREDSRLKVALSAAHGRVTSDFPDLSVPGTWGANTSGVIGSGTGEGRLRASAVGGNISLLRRPYDSDFGAGDSGESGAGGGVDGGRTDTP
jgi:Putative adhesin